MHLKVTRINALVLVILSTIFLFLFVFNTKSPFGKAIYLTEEGFVPAGVRIKKGETVKFINRSNKAFWPASDPHPQHSATPGFDSKKEIMKGGGYEYTFETLGNFRYHNHLNPTQRGVVKVVENDIDTNDCKNIKDHYQRKICYTEDLEDLQISKGDIFALESLDQVIKENPDLKSECHDMAHYLGEAGYWSYSKSKKIIKSEKISICGFGYVHGFMQEFAHHSTDFYSKSKLLCSYFSKDIAYKDPKWDILPEDTCYNGVGHGIVFLNYEDYSDNLTLLAQVSANKCGEIISDPDSLDHCYQGVFSGISGLYLGTHGYLIPLENDALRLCTTFERDFRRRCLANMIPVVGVVYGREIDKLASTVKGFDFEDTVYAYKMIGNIASSWFATEEFDLDGLESACGKLANNYRKSCAKGFSEGLAYYTSFEEAWKTVMTFCKGIGVDTSDTNECKISFFLELETLKGEALEGYIRTLNRKDYQFVCENNIINKYCLYSNN